MNFGKRVEEDGQEKSSLHFERLRLADTVRIRVTDGPVVD